MDKKTIKYILLAGLLLAVIPSIIPGVLDGLIWLSVVLGLVAGYFMSADVKTFLAILVLMGVSAGLSQIPTIGTLLAGVFGQIAVFFGSFAVLPAAKVLIKKTGYSW